MLGAGTSGLPGASGVCQGPPAGQQCHCTSAHASAHALVHCHSPDLLPLGGMFPSEKRVCRSCMCNCSPVQGTGVHETGSLGHHCTILFSCLVAEVLNDLWHRDSQAFFWVHTEQRRPSKSRTQRDVLRLCHIIVKLLEGKATSQIYFQSRTLQPA